MVRLLHITVFNIFNKTPVPTRNKTKNLKRNSDALWSACYIKIQYFLQNLKLDSYALWSSYYISLQCFQQNTRSIDWKQNQKSQIESVHRSFFGWRSQWQCLFQQPLFLHAPYIIICLCFSSTSSSYFFALS